MWYHAYSRARELEANKPLTKNEKVIEDLRCNYCKFMDEGCILCNQPKKYNKKDSIFVRFFKWFLI